MIGEVPLSEALSRAESAGLDLVEVGAQSDPPVCKIIDSGKLAYDQSKRTKQPSKSASRIKTIKLHMRISPHDLELKCSQVSRFLGEGKQVQVVVELRGRERANPYQAIAMLNDVLSRVGCEGDVRGGDTRASIVLSTGNRIKPAKASELVAGAGVDPGVPEAGTEVVDVGGAGVVVDSLVGAVGEAEVRETLAL
jgi:translation initiation factor IF-3